MYLVQTKKNNPTNEEVKEKRLGNVLIISKGKAVETPVTKDKTDDKVLKSVITNETLSENKVPKAKQVRQAAKATKEQKESKSKKCNTGKKKESKKVTEALDTVLSRYAPAILDFLDNKFTKYDISKFFGTLPWNVEAGKKIQYDIIGDVEKEEVDKAVKELVDKYDEHGLLFDYFKTDRGYYIYGGVA